MFIYGNHDAGGENDSSWWGCLCDECVASKKSSEREFFVPAGTHLGIKLSNRFIKFKSRLPKHITPRPLYIPARPPILIIIVL